MIKTIKDNVPSVFKALEELGTYEVVVGFTDQLHKNSSLKVSQIAYIHEFGSPINNIPARPFFYSGVSNARDRIGNLARYYGGLVADGKRGAIKNGLEDIGAEAVRSIRRKLFQGPFEPLAPSTVERKGHDTPLIDTGQMLDSIEYQVRRRSR